MIHDILRHIQIELESIMLMSIYVIKMENNKQIAKCAITVLIKAIIIYVNKLPNRAQLCPVNGPNAPNADEANNIITDILCEMKNKYPQHYEILDIQINDPEDLRDAIGQLHEVYPTFNEEDLYNNLLTGINKIVQRQELTPLS